MSSDKINKNFQFYLPNPSRSMKLLSSDSFRTFLMTGMLDLLSDKRNFVSTIIQFKLFGISGYIPDERLAILDNGKRKAVIDIIPVVTNSTIISSNCSSVVSVLSSTNNVYNTRHSLVKVQSLVYVKENEILGLLKASTRRRAKELTDAIQYVYNGLLKHKDATLAMFDDDGIKHFKVLEDYLNAH